MMQLCLRNGTTILTNPEAVFFDKDGTLIDIHYYWGSMIKRRADLIGKIWFGKDSNLSTKKRQLMDVMGLDLETDKIRQDGPIGVKPRKNIVEIVVGVVRMNGIDVDETDIEKVFLEVDRSTERDLLPLLRLLPGVRRLLEELKNNGIRAGILSTDMTVRAKVTMESLEIANYFDFIFGGDSVKRPKPAPDLVDLAIRHGQYDLGKVAVVGDHPVDIQMGINAGVQTNLGVMTGLSSKRELASYDCWVIKDLTEIYICD